MREYSLTVGIACLLFTFFSNQSNAETKLVSTYNDGLTSYVTFERNGVQYRSDVLGSGFNFVCWTELNPEDRMKVANTYSIYYGRLKDQYGVAGANQMWDWVNQEKGWTSLIQALRQKQMQKFYPELKDFFEKDPEIPHVPVSLAKEELSALELEATEMEKEAQATFDLGKELYQKLTALKWDQVGLSINGMSKDLAKILIDTFINPKPSGTIISLGIKVFKFAMETKNFMEGKLDPNGMLPSPTDAIKRIELFLEEIETDANTAMQRVVELNEKLKILVDQIKKKQEEEQKKKTELIQTKQQEIQSAVQQIPLASPIGLSSEADTEEKRNQEITNKANAEYQKLLDQYTSLQKKYSSDTQDLTTRFLAIIQKLPDFPIYYYPILPTHYPSPYYSMEYPVSTLKSWIDTLYPDCIRAHEKAIDTLTELKESAQTLLDTALEAFHDVEANALGLDAYQGYLGFKPSDFLKPPQEIFNKITVILADTSGTPDIYIEQFQKKIDILQDSLTGLQSNLPTHIARMETNMRDYTSLKSNFENSLSLVVGTLRQLDRLHTLDYFHGGHMFVGESIIYLNGTPPEVDLVKIQQRLGAIPDKTEKQKALDQEVEHLMQILTEERRLIHILTIAQNNAYYDYQQLGYMIQGFTGYPLKAGMQNDVFAVTGIEYKMPDKIRIELTDDWYFYWISTNPFHWVRDDDNVRTNILDAIEELTGKNAFYYTVTEYLHYIEKMQDTWLGLSDAEYHKTINAAFAEYDRYGMQIGDGYPRFIVGNLDSAGWTVLMDILAALIKIDDKHRVPNAATATPTPKSGLQPSATPTAQPSPTAGSQPTLQPSLTPTLQSSPTPGWQPSPTRTVGIKATPTFTIPAETPSPTATLTPVAPGVGDWEWWDR